MPRGNRTGPMGAGPMSGRGMGYCAGNPGPGNMGYGPGLGFGRGLGFRGGFGRGLGFGRGRGWNQAGFGYPLDKEQEIASLSDQAKMLEDELALIKQRQEEIKNQKRQDTSTKE